MVEIIPFCACCDVVSYSCFFFFKQKTAYEMRISDWSSDVCSSDLRPPAPPSRAGGSSPHHPDEALLHHRHGQLAVGGVEVAAPQAPAPGGRWGVLAVEQPLVGPERAGERHGVGETGTEQVGAVPAPAGREPHGVEQRTVARAGEHAGVEHRVGWE